MTQAFCVLVDFQKAAAMIQELQLKLSEEPECAELRDALNLALLHMQKYYRLLRNRLQKHETVSNGNGAFTLVCLCLFVRPSFPLFSVTDLYNSKGGCPF